MRGPCAILSDTWTGDRDLPLNLGKNVVDYLIDLKTQLEAAQEYADEHTSAAQKSYAARYNLRSREKHFEVGDHVLLLAPDSTKSKTLHVGKGLEK